MEMSMRAKEYIDEGRIGELLFLRPMSVTPGARLRERPADAGRTIPNEGDAFLDWGSHACDAIRWFTGADARARLRRLRQLHRAAARARSHGARPDPHVEPARSPRSCSATRSGRRASGSRRNNQYHDRRHQGLDLLGPRSRASSWTGARERPDLELPSWTLPDFKPRDPRRIGNTARQVDAFIEDAARRPDAEDHRRGRARGDRDDAGGHGCRRRPARRSTCRCRRRRRRPRRPRPARQPVRRPGRLTMTIERLEIFVARLPFSPRAVRLDRATATRSAYAVVKLTRQRRRRRAGARPTCCPACAAIIEDRRAASWSAARRRTRIELKAAFANGRRARVRRVGDVDRASTTSGRASAGVPDLRAVRRPDAATRSAPTPRSTGYIEGVGSRRRPGPTETEQLASEGYTAIKMRIGRYPLQHEGPLYEQVRRDLPATRRPHGRRQRRLHAAPGDRDGARAATTSASSGSRSRCTSGTATVGYELLNAATDIALAGGEITMSRNAARDFVDNRKADIFQPEPVICGGISETLFYRRAGAPERDGARARTRRAARSASRRRSRRSRRCPTRRACRFTTCRCSRSASDPNPWRTDLFSTPLRQTERLGRRADRAGSRRSTVDEAFVRRRAKEVRVVMASARMRFGGAPA